MKPLIATKPVTNLSIAQAAQDIETSKAQNAALSSGLQTILKTLLAFQVRLDAFTNLASQALPDHINDETLKTEVARITEIVENGIAENFAKEPAQ